MSIRVSGQGFARAAEVKLYDNTLTAVGSFDVTGIPPSFTNLHLTLLTRGDAAVTLEGVRLFFNGDTTAANYRHGYARGQGPSNNIQHVQGDNAFIAFTTAANGPANYFGLINILIPSYASTDYTQVNQVLANYRGNASLVESFMTTFHWENTAVINQITLQTDNDPTDEFVATSRLQIWGEY